MVLAAMAICAVTKVHAAKVTGLALKVIVLVPKVTVPVPKESAGSQSFTRPIQSARAAP